MAVVVALLGAATPGIVGATMPSETDEWIKKYKPGSLKRKRVEIFTRMDGFE